MNKVRAIIEQETSREGIITFARFMDLALYCPNIGYYERLEHSPGRRGDFFTSVSVGDLFGEFLGSRMAGWIQELASPTSQLVEAGAHDDRLARDVLRHWRECQKSVFASTEYWIIEPSPTRQESQAQTLAEFAGRVRWFRDWNSVPAAGITGVIFFQRAARCHARPSAEVGRQKATNGSSGESQIRMAILPGERSTNRTIKLQAPYYPRSCSTFCRTASPPRCVRRQRPGGSAPRRPCVGAV